MIPFLEKLLRSASWRSLPSSPQASSSAESPVTHEGVFKIDEFELHCYRTTEGELAVDLEDLERFFRGCHLCDHPSQCPDCNPSEDERSSGERTGLIIGKDQQE